MDDVVAFVDASQEHVTEMNRPEAIIDLLKADEVLLEGVGDEQQPLLQADGTGRDLIYVLGPQRDSYFTIDSEWLLIWLVRRADSNDMRSQATDMRPLARVGLVLGGYGPDRQAYSGMYGFGDDLLFLAVFGIAAVPASGAALFLLKLYRAFWLALSIAALGIAATALAALIGYVAARTADAPSLLHTWSGLAALRILVAPLFALGFLLSGLLAPNRSSRFALLAATVLEAAVFAYVAFVWSTHWGLTDIQRPDLTGRPIWLYCSQNAIRGRPGPWGGEGFQISAGLPPGRSPERPRTALAARADPSKQEPDQTSPRLAPAAVSPPGRGSEAVL